MRFRAVRSPLLAVIALGLGAAPAAAQSVTFLDLADTVVVQHEGTFGSFESTSANSLVLVANGLPQLVDGYFRDTQGDGIFLPAQVWAQVGEPPTPVRHTSWGRIKTSYR